MSILRTLAPALFLLASPAFAGWSMTQVTTSSGDRGAQDAGTTQRVWMDGGSAKVELVGTGNPMMEPGGYLLIQDGGNKMFMVNPGRKTYARFDVMAMTQGMDAMAGSGFEISIEDPKVVKLVEEPGGEMLGQATTHYRYRTTYMMVTSMPGGMKMTMAKDILEDLWTAPAIEAGRAGQAIAGMAGGEGMRQELRQLEQQAKATLVGLPLKQVTVTASKSTTKGSGVMGLLGRRAGGGGGSDTFTTTMVAKDLVEASLPASTFQIPPGFAETEMMQRGPAMPNLGEDGH